MATAKKSVWGVALALGMAGAGLIPTLALADAQPPIVCSALDDESSPDTALAWLARSMVAGHCYDFQARAVTIDAIGVRTLALSHRIRDGVRQQVVQHLDGPSVSVERRSIAGYMARFTPNEGKDPSASQAWAQHIASYYDVSLQENTRVAGRDAVALRFVPQDQQRYQHAWWVDKSTGLLLKHVLSDHQDRVLETFQITQLQSPVLYEGHVASDVTTERSSFSWRVDWLPEGFIAQPQEPGQSAENQQVFSDGLAAVSLFVTPVEQPMLEEGVHRLGVSTAAISMLSEGEQRWQLIGIGELPPATLERVVQSVRIESR
ncbi:MULTISPECIES: MucB/RseB C-terminal domain-containing protein [unclassified Halomonas]|uniref:MucB/RseB C-terminal domain-containing protein n=1 Tax=unclassified Halomonas TaxID=2609666 RepID=UPI001EF52A48|nr:MULTISPECIES: MucB/RseB C-terminal domain-containing protein [unclassified Halomonas]MCG7575508.1 MucB/RseB C-terminal domain-containing protein [Halomonas sp. MMH1-48]MCG7602570.1 MucB/RseB C-terminal domain-containing protein [Halomonas sp. MM17-34]MCG7611672.1 MucB/RseB C-terminal domain-containing protein [Halomonas sp. MM17-29]MCG7618553.1 MucB/RseB C-terminal domain-containing protein [Halomonas sp. DSH1-27]